MALTLVLETGSGLANSNSYASVAECDAYHDAHLYSDDWTGAAAVTGKQDKALAMASRVIDGAMKWRGDRKSAEQALEWPRINVERDGMGGAVYNPLADRPGAYWPDDTIHKPIKDAVCELARLLIGSDRTAEDSGKGLSRVGLGNGAVDVTFDKYDRKSPIADQVLAILAPLGYLRSGSMQHKVSR